MEASNAGGKRRLSLSRAAIPAAVGGRQASERPVGTPVTWSTGHVYIPDSASSFQRIMGHWMDKQVKTSTVRVFSTHEDMESLKQPSNIASIEIL